MIFPFLLTVRSLAPICSSTTSTLYSELIFMQSLRARHRQKKVDGFSILNSGSQLTVYGLTDITALLCHAMYTRVIGGHTVIYGPVWLLARQSMIFLSFCGITGCGSASLKLCISNAASPWSQSPSLDSQCRA